MRKIRFFAIILCLTIYMLPSSALADEPVILQNPEFLLPGRGGVPEGWYTEAWYDADGDSVLSITELDGEPCLHIVNSIHNDARLCQQIPVEENSIYRIECDVMTRGVADGAGANVSVVDTIAISEPVLGDSDWQRITLTGRTDQDAESIIIALRLGGYGDLSVGEAWFKNIAVTRLDSEPGGSIAAFSAAKHTDDDEPHVTGLYGGVMLLAALCTALVGNLVYKKRILAQQDGLRPRSESAVYIALAAAFFIRCAISPIFYGHSTDIVCFTAWADALASGGLSNFYTSGMFADYPPGYMYILYAVGNIFRALDLAYGGAGHVLLVKMPGIIADIAASYLIYRIAKKRMPLSAAFTLMCFVAFNPAMAFISGGWGQIDQITALLLLFTILLFMDDRLELAGLIYGIAIITKPQSLMAGPLLAAAYFLRIYDGGPRYIRRTAVAVASSIAAILLLSLPFRGGQHPLWFMEKLLGTATSYPYASVEAFNIFALIGANWKPAESTFLFFSYGTWGTIGIVLSCAFSMALYFKGRDKREALMLCMAVALAGIFTFGQYMHERYVFPVLMLMAAAYAIRPDRRFVQSIIWYTPSLLINVLAAFVIVDRPELRTGEYAAVTVIGSLVTLLSFIHLARTAWSVLIKGEEEPSFTVKYERRAAIAPSAAGDDERGLNRKDRICCLALTAVYALSALVNLGTLQAPENPYIGASGDSVVITLDEAAEIAELRVFGGLYDGTVTFTADSGEVIEYSEINDHMFRWVKVNSRPFAAKELTMEVTSGKVWFIELAAFDSSGNMIGLTASQGGEALVDEPDMVPVTPSMLNGMYFDELYHARTAFEHLNGIAPYENSHPPLGKIFIMLGIAVFGMNTFGWRIVGTLFGIAMIPILYAFAKALFRRSDYAFIASALFAVDFMHFTQTRIATIDVYGVFFIILMFYFMYRYYCMNFYTDGLRRTLLPLALAGVCFGLGTASKWIAIYAGGGLAVIFFTSLTQRYIEFRRLKANGTEQERQAVACFGRNAVITLLWCCLFYIAVPVTIYILSYIPYMLSEARYDLNGIWEIQQFMFGYHSTLTASHPYESSWWQWPLDLRPVWYYVSYYVKEGFSATISAFGNPAVWWGGSLSAVLVTAKVFMADRRLSRGEFVLLVAMAANYLPWVLVPRCTFAYHFFAMVPFIILASVYVIRDLELRRPRLCWVKWAYLGAGAALFVLFYPVISGTEAGIGYIRALEWLPGWTFMGY